MTGRLQRHVDDCVHPIAGATVELCDVDYCWWWYSQDVIKSGVTDVNGFFDISFTWCVPLFCLFEVPRKPPILIDPDLRDRLRAALERQIPIKFPPPPPRPDPLEWEKQLAELGMELPSMRRLQQSSLELPQAREVGANRLVGASRSLATLSPVVATNPRIETAAQFSAADIFGPILRWPPCDEPCDWLPDIKIRVTQTQPAARSSSIRTRTPTFISTRSATC